LKASFPGAIEKEWIMIKQIQAGKEIVVLAPNRVGVLSEVSKLLAKHSINIIAVSAQSAGGVALMNLIVDQSVRAIALLLKKGLRIYENDVVLVEAEDHPGLLMKISQRLAAKKVDLAHLYATTPMQRRTRSACCLIVIASGQTKKVIAALRGARHL